MYYLYCLCAVVYDTCCVFLCLVCTVAVFPLSLDFPFLVDTSMLSDVFVLNNNYMIEKHHISKFIWTRYLIRYLWVIQYIFDHDLRKWLFGYQCTTDIITGRVQKRNWPHFCNNLLFHTSLSEIANLYWTMCNSVIIK